jgi:hypothetical protein
MGVAYVIILATDQSPTVAVSDIRYPQTQGGTPSPTLPKPLVLAWLNSWDGAHMLRFEPVISLLTMATGLQVVLHDTQTPLDGVDVFLISQFGSKDHVREVKAAHGNHSIFLWWGGEAVEDNFVDIADVSLGQALEPVHFMCEEALHAPNFIRMPYWMTVAVAARGSPLRCELDPRLYAAAEITPDVWAARPGFALHVSSHGGWPRDSIVSEFAALAAELDANATTARSGQPRRMDCPGAGYHNTEWPSEIPNDGDRGVGKVLLAQRYRFSVQPESTESTCRGYTTEKLVQGLMGGAVPVYWGDPLDAQVRKRGIFVD